MTNKSGKFNNQRDLHRRIFLNTMRSVYPNSIQISYHKSLEDDRFNLKPLTVSAKCNSIKDKLWVDLLYKLHIMFQNHVRERFKVMLITWSTLVFLAILYLVLGSSFNQLNQLWFKAAGPSIFILAMILLPGTIFNFFVMKPMLKDFESWKRDLTVQFDKHGVEVIKVTSGEIVSDKSPRKWLGRVYYGSGVWFRYEDFQMEIFWRYIKNGSRVRRYSLMVTDGISASSSQSSVSQSAMGSSSSVNDPKDYMKASIQALNSIVDSMPEENKQVEGSKSTIGSAYYGSDQLV